MKRSVAVPALLLAARSVPLSAAAPGDSAAGAASNLRRGEPLSAEEYQRLLKIDFFDRNVDVCKNGDAGTADDFGPCDESKFPRCEEGKELICYNRTNRRDKFYEDKHPYFYIDYDRVLCYPAFWQGLGGCSSCTPGRYCASEGRCILDEKRYRCPDWPDN